MKHVNKFLMDKAFTYHIKDYDNLNREYILVNTITKEVKRVPKADVDEMIEEQHHHDTSDNRAQHHDQQKKAYNDPHTQLHDPHHDFHQPKLHDPHHDLHHHTQLHDPHHEKHE